MERKKKLLQKCSYFFQRLALVWRCANSILFGPHAHSMGGTGLRSCKFCSCQNLDMHFQFLAYISVQNELNFNFRVPLESHKTQLHESGFKNSIAIMELGVITQFPTLDYFCPIYWENSISHCKFCRREFLNRLGQFVQFFVGYNLGTFSKFQNLRFWPK